MRVTTFLPLSLLCLPAAAEVYVWNQTWESVSQLEEILKTVPEGRELWEKALKNDPQLPEHISAGDVSFSENITALGINSSTERTPAPQQKEIKIKRQHKLGDAVADLAHELVHFTERRTFDPMKETPSVAAYVRHGIEGPGGELAAFAKECELVWSLEFKHPAFPRHQTCQKYRKERDHFDRETARRDFYAVGSWLEDFEPNEKTELPHLSNREPIFLSGVYKKPYPAALRQAFPSFLHDACANLQSSYQLLFRKARKGLGTDIIHFQNEGPVIKKFLRQFCDKG